MLSGWDIYWITRLDGLQNFILITTMLTLVGAVIHIGSVCEIDDGIPLRRKIKFLLPIYYIIFFINLLAYFLIPSTKTMFAIKVLPKIVNNEDVQKLPELAVKYSKEWLQKQIKELVKDSIEGLDE